MSEFFPVFLAVGLLFSAHVSAQTNNCTDPVICNSATNYFEKINLRHAKRISDLTFSNTYVDFTVTSTQPKQGPFPYRLVRCGCPPGNPPSNTQVIFVPPRRLYVDDGPTIGMLAHGLESSRKVVAVGSRGLIYHGEIRSRITKNTKFTELNKTDIDLSFINFFSVTGYEGAKTQKPFFVNGELQENTPLGRSEWVKILGLIVNKADIAATTFDRVVASYSEASRLAAAAKRRPSVLLNYPFGDKWSVPSEMQYTTELLRAANADYVFMNDGGNQTNSLELEEVLGNFTWARYLINSGQFRSKGTAMSALFAPPDARNATLINRTLRNLTAVHCANVWVRNKRLIVEGESQSNDYFEWGVLSPDLILRDIIHMLHPNIDIGGAPVFSFKLEDAPASVKGGECPYNDLFGKAPAGMAYVDTSMAISGMDRFQVENQLVRRIIPEVAMDEKIDAKSIDAFFEKPQENSSTTLTLRTMVRDADVKAVIDGSDARVSAVRLALGSGVTVKRLGAVAAEGETLVDPPGATRSSRLSAGAVAGIVIGALVAAVLIAAAVYWAGRKVGRRTGAVETRDQFWNEHQVRLADDVDA